MVCGTTSGAGKSLLATALARWYARRGLKVAPFKAQNMSNNARVVADGEMGSAQYFQALAARCVPDVRMNPVLLKPESDTHSQVILLGERRDDLSQIEWRERSAHLWPTIQSCLDELRSSHDVLIIEGAGSPAEINLQSTDIVNMRVAEAAAAATLLICDIDRGGAFAHLYGTHQLLSPQHRALLRGFVLNKFRGDPALLSPAPEMLRAVTGLATLAVLPMWREHGLPEEDGVFDARPSGEGLSIAIVAYPRISNLDEFAALRRVPGVSLSWARQAQSIASADLLILPGSKHVAGDLSWLRANGLDAAIAAHLRADKPTLAICGGLQMLGTELRDPDHVEEAAKGLGLLPYSTVFQRRKRYRRGTYTFGALRGFWTPLARLDVEAYEIRHGETRALAQQGTAATLSAALPQGCGWQYGQTLALYVHGMFESPAVLRALFGQRTPTLDDTLDGLADFIDGHFAHDALMGLIERG
ncbi:MAG: cobyric acid synthase [Steroidobacteraceae bacterium]|jgi:adenosylcobyric acid synthase